MSNQIEQSKDYSVDPIVQSFWDINNFSPAECTEEMECIYRILFNRIGQIRYPDDERLNRALEDITSARGDIKEMIEVLAGYEAGYNTDEVSNEFYNELAERYLLTREVLGPLVYHWVEGILAEFNKDTDPNKKIAFIYRDGYLAHTFARHILETREDEFPNVNLAQLIELNISRVNREPKKGKSSSDKPTFETRGDEDIATALQRVSHEKRNYPLYNRLLPEYLKQKGIDYKSKLYVVDTGMAGSTLRVLQDLIYGIDLHARYFQLDLTGANFEVSSEESYVQDRESPLNYRLLEETRIPRADPADLFSFLGRSHNFVVGDGAVRAESNLLKKSYARKGRPGLELLYLAIMERGYRDYLQSLKDGKVKPPEREVTKEKMIQKARDIYFGDIDANRPGLHLISARRYPSKLLSGLRIGTDDDEQVYLDKTFKY